MVRCVAGSFSKIEPLNNDDEFFDELAALGNNVIDMKFESGRLNSHRKEFILELYGFAHKRLKLLRDYCLNNTVEG